MNNIKDYIKEYYSNMIVYNAKYFVKNLISSDRLTDIILNEDLSSINYLYKTGEYISNNEIKIVEYFNNMSSDKINELATVVVNGFLKGYDAQNLDYSNKTFVTLYYPLGFEKMAKEVYNLLSDKFKIVFEISSSTNPNKQFDFFHKNNRALYIDDNYVNKFLCSYENEMTNNYDILKNYGGQLYIETFGAKRVLPKKDVLICFNKDYSKCLNKLNNKFNQLYKKYTNSNERSFTIISYPCPDIGDNFEEIFNEVIKINTLDCNKYEKIHQKIIDVLDLGDYVHIKGKGENKTDLVVNLHKLADPETETNFENCTADVNIPVGEVFTSPVLNGTNGVLYVSEVYLNGLKFTDLEINIKDGKTVSYNCSIFDDKKHNLEYIEDNILYRYDSLPMGEFAIGTNTLAYIIARKYNIQDKLDILIAEKTGPHFAFGDTCFSNQEDIDTYNPDGKKIVAKDNEISLLRKTDISKAYFGCHTDITIPFDELESINVVTYEGNEISIIQDGKFVLPGTEELNIPLENI